MFRPMLVVCALAALAAAEDFEEWKKLKSSRVVTGRHTAELEGKASKLDDCLELVEKFMKPESYAVAFDGKLELCQAFKLSALGKYDSASRTVTWFDSESREADPEKADEQMRYLLAKREKREVEDGISDGEIVATVVLAIFYALVITACAFLCKEEKSDIAGQMERLEKAEEEKHERASEEWERRSHEEEEAARKEAEEVEQKELQ